MVSVAQPRQQLAVPVQDPYRHKGYESCCASSAGSSAGVSWFGAAQAVSAAQARQGDHTEEAVFDAFLVRRDSSWSQGQQAYEDSLDQYELDYDDALSELRDDVFDAQLDSLDEAYEEALQEWRA